MQEIITLQASMKKYKKTIKSLLIFLVVAVPLVALAQVTIPNPIGYSSLGELIHAIVSFIRNVALMIAPIIFIIAGLMYYFAGGNPDKAKQATDLIKYALIGLVIILIANGITAIITDIMGINN
jgi:type IV secretory pathway VirB2 component (pilin)